MKPHAFFAVLAAFACVIFVSPAAAHELGKTQAVASFRDGAYEIDVVVDPDALLGALEAYGHRPISGDLPRAERDRRIAALAGVFLDRTTVMFDGRPAAPAFEYRPASAFSDLAETPSAVRLRGALPADAREFSFRYGLALGTCALNVRIGEGAVRTQWIVGAATSVPVSLVAPAPPPGRLDVGLQYFLLGFTHILPGGTDHVLFVVGIL